jgi:Domain of unknown function (DUF1707)/2TM domain
MMGLPDHHPRSRLMELEPGREPRPGGMRASDADRERTVEQLRRHHADGRLDLEEFSERMERAYTAKTLAELDELMTDLPRDAAPAAPAPAGSLGVRRARLRQSFYRSLATYVSVNAMLVGIWAFSGRGYFWPIWVMMGWGVAVVAQAVRALGPGAGLDDQDEPGQGRQSP